jgi:hypothetical protein
MRGFVERVEFAAPPGPPGRHRRIARCRGGVDEPVKNQRVVAAVLGRRCHGPVVGELRQKISAAQRDSAGQVAGGGQRAELDDVHPRRTRSERNRRTRRRQSGLAERLAQRPDRGSQACPSRRRWAARPKPSRQRVAIVRTGPDGEQGQHARGGNRQHDRQPVALHGVRTEYPHPQHLLMVATALTCAMTVS